MEVITALICCVLLLVLLYKSTAKRRRFIAMIDKLPGPPKYPLIGTILEILMAPKNRFVEIDKTYRELHGPIYRMWVGHIGEVHMSSPECYEPIISGMKHIEKGWTYQFLHPWLGLGLLTSGGSKWHSRRKIITPAFHFQILETFSHVFVENSQTLVKKLQREMKVHGEKGFDICPFITRCTLDIICETAMGVKVNAQDETGSEYMQAVLDCSVLTIKRGMRPWMHSDFIFYLSNMGRRYKQCLQILHGFTRKIIQERRTSRCANAQIEPNDDENILGRKQRLAFLDLLLASSDEGKILTDKDIQEEVDTFMFEGHDTTNAAISWALFLLGCYPDVQEKVAEELDGIFQGSDRPVTTRDCQEMKYLERVIKETLRLYPSVPVIIRNLEGETECAGYTLPDGVLVIIHILQSHLNPKHFPDPEKFDPDNFLPERVQNRHPYAYIPFSAGPRNCIGQKFAMLEQKIVLASILRHFKLRSVDRREDVRVVPELILRPEEGIQMVLTRRERTL